MERDFSVSRAEDTQVSAIKIDEYKVFSVQNIMFFLLLLRALELLEDFTLFWSLLKSQRDDNKTLFVDGKSSSISSHVV